MTREEAIECNKSLRMYMRLSDKNQPCKFHEDNYIALDMANKSLEQTRWIPVSEKLPEEGKEVLITIQWSDGVRTVEKTMLYDVNLWKGFGRYINVIAWTELPKPYEESSGDEE